MAPAALGKPRQRGQWPEKAMRGLEEARSVMVPGVANRVLAAEMRAVLAIGEDRIRRPRRVSPGPGQTMGAPPAVR